MEVSLLFVPVSCCITQCSASFPPVHASSTSLAPTRRWWTWRNPTTAACQQSSNIW